MKTCGTQRTDLLGFLLGLQEIWIVRGELGLNRGELGRDGGELGLDRGVLRL